MSQVVKFPHKTCACACHGGLRGDASDWPHCVNCDGKDAGVAAVSEKLCEVCGREIAVIGEPGCHRHASFPGQEGRLECYRLGCERLPHVIAAAEERGRRSGVEAKNAAYAERNQCVALIVRMALALGWPAGVRDHEDKPGEAWEPDWRNLVCIDLPTGQVSWHFHDSEKHLLAGLPQYPASWDGHDTAEKYRRVNAAGWSFSALRDQEAARLREGLLQRRRAVRGSRCREGSQMTPPDSGERYGESCEVAGCIRRKGHAPPHTTEIVDEDDSGEREECEPWPVYGMASTGTWHRVTVTSGAMMDTACGLIAEPASRFMSGPDTFARAWCPECLSVPAPKHVSLPLSLAQRILAALEGETAQHGYVEFQVLAAELRAIVERKPDQRKGPQ